MNAHPRGFACRARRGNRWTDRFCQSCSPRSAAGIGLLSFVLLSRVYTGDPLTFEWTCKESDQSLHEVSNATQ